MGSQTQQHRHDRAINMGDAIAVVGMSIKVAGADDLDEFSNMLRTGESQHQLIGPERLMTDTLFREGEGDPSRKWYGNFVRDVDAFDHKFFKRSPRESATMDPQQRLFLQSAYQAVDQSGYFSEPRTAGSRDGSMDGRDKNHVGVYLGACASDYEHHAACHTPNAFTATGNLKSFIPGKVSHYFGWTGPSIAFDTACSTSAVALHTACRNLLSGDCSAALVGGVSVMTNYLWFQNLAAASFLSPTGQCKPFDNGGDGYCRAEGVACVFLKRMADAMADGNPILGCVASTAVYQNDNSTPLFVPNAPSLSRLFTDVIRKAGLEARDISLVEAHGTGTPVGDPAEYESIRIALGGPEARQENLPIGSVKGHIGHTEGASGIISLIKIIVMMNGGYIPPQASFSQMSRYIKTRPDDMMEVVTSLRPWKGQRKAALVNNYGACGSNASMIIMQSPQSQGGRPGAPLRDGACKSAFPFRISGLDPRSIAAYCAKLLAQLSRGEAGDLALADVSFNVNRQFNPSLAHSLIFSCRTEAELREKLSAASTATSIPVEAGVVASQPERPVILCFGGQVSKNVGLDRTLYDGVSILRRNLDLCDSVAQTLGLGSIYPDIFSRTPVEDTVKLQTMLFAMQWACAKSWIDSGIATNVTAVVGHSFGEITALCVSGVLSLRDTMKLVASRARLVRDSWGPEKGAMMAVEADEELLDELLAAHNNRSDGQDRAAVACYNGPRSFTLAGSTKAIDGVAATLATDARFSGIKAKRLNVTNAFHSSLVEPLLSELEDVGRDLTFNTPSIALERATESKSTAKLTAMFVPDHMRRPVFFNHAIQRLAQEQPSAIFLEAGSSSTITIMASRALAGKPCLASQHFQALNLTTDKGLDNLVDATVSLWKQGLRASFWPHHPIQAAEFATMMMLPPYQFEKFHHWMDLKSPLEAVAKAAAALGPSERLANDDSREAQGEKAPGLWTFLGSGAEAGKQRFRINARSKEYMDFISGHLIAQTASICPATLEVDMAIEALFSLHPEWKTAGLQPVLHDMVNHSPLCVDPTRVVYLDFEPADDHGSLWNWKIFSVSGDLSKDAQTHVEARLHIRAPSEAAYEAEFARFERLVSHSRCADMLKLGLSVSGGDDMDVDVLTGRNVYRAFADVVDYGELYRGVRAVVGRGSESVGLVHKRHAGQTWVDVPLSDSFSQVGGIWVNCMAECGPGDMFIATGCEMNMRSPRAPARAAYSPEGPDTWHVLARHTRQSEKVYMTDLFVFDPQDGQLCEVMLGVQYARVAKASMRKMLTRLTNDDSVMKPAAAAVVRVSPTSSLPGQDDGHAAGVTTDTQTQEPTLPNKPASQGQAARRDLTDDVRNLVADVAGIDEASEIKLDSDMADFGIDSLMGMELAREVQVVFKCTLDQDELMEATTLRKFVICINHALYGPGDDAAGSGEDEAETSSSETPQGASSISSSSSSSSAATSSPDLDSSPPKKIELPEAQAQTQTQTQAEAAPALSSLQLTQADILNSFGEVKLLCDEHIREYKLDDIDHAVIAATNVLSTALVVEAFEELGCSLRSAVAGQTLERVPFQPQHGRLMDFIYRFLQNDARLIDIDPASGLVTRSHMSVPRKPSQAILQELLAAHPEFVVANMLTHYAGTHLAGVLSGKTDGLRVIFGSTKGRELVQALYCDHTFNRMNYRQMRLVVENLTNRIRGRQRGETLKILEVGAGTGGTTYVLAPFLATLDMPVEYTFTDISPSMVANARRKFGKLYPFMRFAVHDIEKSPADALRGQHIIIGSNAIHATHNLVSSAGHLHSALRADGFLMMLEMTESAPFLDLIFGLLEGWWLFDDGRKHAIITAKAWERDLHAAGFAHVDWTDGHLPENAFQKVMIALASGPVQDRLPKGVAPVSDNPHQQQQQTPAQVAAREAEAESYVAKYTAGFEMTVPLLDSSHSHGVRKPTDGAVVVLTGATGSLGSHLAAALAGQVGVATVVCLNRRSSGTPAEQRQLEALSARGIELSAGDRAKLRILEADTSKPRLGLAEDEYAWITLHGTHIVHNAWPMSGTRPLRGFEPQFASLRNLLDLARDMACRSNDGSDSPVSFQLVSSIGVVGSSRETQIIEQRVPMSDVLPIGYCEAKWTCERMLDETLHRHAERFRAMVVRPGQIAGSRTSGFWNPVEHFAFLVKSAQTLRAWPDFDGVLQWVPVNDVAAAMVDLLHLDSVNPRRPHAVYHIDNPVGQPWKDMSPVLAGSLAIPQTSIIPFAAWVRRVRHSPVPAETDNPAARLADFLQYNFERMSCGGLILDTAHSQEHSRTMAAGGPVAAEVARKYIAGWKAMGFLHA